MVACPASVEELSEVVRDGAAIWLSLGGWDVVSTPSNLDLSGLSGIVELSPSDMVVTVRSGTKLVDLQGILGEHGLCLPMPMEYPFLTSPGFTLANHLALNLPHGLDAQCGSWRDWVLGMRMVLVDGMICTSGSKVVKSVAGYDVHKLMIGARHTLAIVAEVTLKVFPLAALPKPEVVVERDPLELKPHGWWVHRTRPSDFDLCLRSHGDRVLAVDPAGSVVWALAGENGLGEVTFPDPPSMHFHGSPKPSFFPPRFAHDVLIGYGLGPLNFSLNDPAAGRLLSRAKAVLDPTNKLNPGAFGPL